ncbi:hypothetical protein LTR95_003187 [Oleoguttula sp. CCFEE 5521]
MTAPSTTGAGRSLDDDTLLRPLSRYTPVLSEEDDFILQLKEDENLSWDDIVLRFRHDRSEEVHSAALMMRYKRLREGYPKSEHQRAQPAMFATHDTGDSVVKSSGPYRTNRGGRLPTPPEAAKSGLCPVAGCKREVKDLGSHMLTHQTQRPEKCPIPTCEYHTRGFARKYDKNRHILTHYKGMMVCDFCPGSGSAAEKSFNRADVFKRHLVQVHQVEQTLPNTRSYKHTRKAATKGTGVLDLQRSGKCSVCEATITNPQKLYDHLGDCVLRVIQDATRVDDESKTTRPDKEIVVASVLPEQNSRYRVMYGVESDDEFWPQPVNYLVSEDDLEYDDNFPMSRNTSSKSRDSAYYSNGSVAAGKPDLLDVSEYPLQPLRPGLYYCRLTESKLPDISEETEDGESSYCYCQRPSYGEMVACDDPTCQREWFRLACTGLSALPKELDIWTCDFCEAKSETATTHPRAEATSSKIVPATVRQTYPPSHTLTQNAPCNTLVVSMLPAQTSENELVSLFSSQPGYKRLRFCTKQSGPTCLVEFEDSPFAAKAVTALYGSKLNNGTDEPIRLSFAKSSLGVGFETASKSNSFLNSHSALTEPPAPPLHMLLGLRGSGAYVHLHGGSSTYSVTEPLKEHLLDGHGEAENSSNAMGSTSYYIGGSGIGSAPGTPRAPLLNVNVGSPGNVIWHATPQVCIGLRRKTVL